MALSNWDTFALSRRPSGAGPCDGVFRSKMGVEVEIYKNWLYVRHERAWAEGAFARPTVMEVQHGEIDYLDVAITAVRGPQDGIYAVVTERRYRPDPENVMVGCGVYGYAQDSEEPRWLGVRAESVRFLRSHLQQVAGQYRTWTIDDDKYWAADKVARFNQGDRYFAERVGQPIPATAPDEAEEPLLTQMMKQDLSGG